MLEPRCSALPRQGWQGGGAGATAGKSLTPARLRDESGAEDPDLGAGGLLADTPALCPTTSDSLLSTMPPWGAAWSS